MAIAVFPVCLSPMMSSRWPRPIGTYEYFISNQHVIIIFVKASGALSCDRVGSACGVLTYQGVDGLETSLHGFVDGLSGDDTRGLQLDSLSLVRQDGTFTINGVAEGVDDTAEHAGTDWDIDDGAGSLHNISFLNFSEWRSLGFRC